MPASRQVTEALPAALAGRRASVRDRPRVPAWSASASPPTPRASASTSPIPTAPRCCTARSPARGARRVRGARRHDRAHHRTILARGRLRRAAAAGRPGPAAPRRRLRLSRRPAASARTAGHAGRHRSKSDARARSSAVRPPPFPSAWRSPPRIAGRAGDAGARDASAMLAFSRRSAHRHPALGGRFDRRRRPARTSTRQAAFRRFPLRLGAYWPVPLGVGQLEPGLGLDLDLISVSIPNDGTQLRSPSSCSGRPVSQRRRGPRARMVRCLDASRLPESAGPGRPGGVLRLRRQPRMVTRYGVRQAPTSRSL